MKNTFHFFLLSLVLASCNSNTTIDTNTSTKDDSTNQVTIDTSDPEKFIESYCKKRSENLSEEVTIEGSLAFSKDDFYLFNFTEMSDGYSCQYAIALNPFEKNSVNNNDNSARIDAHDLLLSENINASLYAGHFLTSLDFQDDGSNDFILDEISGYRTTSNHTQTIVLYNGKNELTLTEIKTRTEFEEADDPKYSHHIEETFEFKKDKPVTIIAHCIRKTGENPEMKYDNVWRWTKQSNWGNTGEWETGLKCYDLSNKYYQRFKEQCTYLEEHNGQFFIQENCQNGGAGFFKLERVKSDLSDFYRISSDGDDVGYDAVLWIQQIDSITYKMFTARGEKFDANIAGNTEVFIDWSNNYITVIQDTQFEDIEWHSYGSDELRIAFTRNPDKYEFLKCE